VPVRRFASTARLQEIEPEIERPEQTLDKSISLSKRLQQVEQHIDYIFNSPKVESEEVILRALYEIEAIAKRAITIRAGEHSVKLNLRQSSASSILSLGADDTPKKASSKFPAPKNNDLPSPGYLSRLAEDLLKNPKVFISAAVLSKYVDLQRLLNKPRAIPIALHLYANKPIPQLGSSPPKYTKPSPKGYKQAIPADVAEKALQAAIDAKDMPLCLSVIDNTYCAPAWKTYKIVTKVAPLATAAAVTPFILWAIAKEFSLYSGYYDPDRFRLYSFMGLSTYVWGTGTLGYIALTTYNDHHDRVVWRPGMGLTQRWIREDERNALDLIAQAWGFKEKWKRGDEEGEEWEGLKEWCLLRGMQLDKPELMPGMNPGNT
jgi:hypothetical protein